MVYHQRKLSIAFRVSRLAYLGVALSSSRSESGDGTGSSCGSSSGTTLAHEGISKQHARSLGAAAEAMAGEAMDLDGISTAAAAAAPPRETTHGQATEALHEGAEYEAETGNAAETPKAAAVARVRPPSPSNRGSMTRGQRQRWKQQGGRPRLNSDHGGI